MTTHTFNGYTVLMPDIPEGAEFTETGGYYFDSKKGVMYGNVFDDSPPGDWQLFRLSEVPESLAGEIVEKERDPWGFLGWMNYDKEHSSYLDFNFDTAHASLTSWVRAQGVEENDPYLLIRKIG